MLIRESSNLSSRTFARVAGMADARGLKPRVLGRAGSNPASSTFEIGVV